MIYCNLITFYKAKLQTIEAQKTTYSRNGGEIDLLDCFEPTYIRESLEQSDGDNLSHLIFNDESPDGHRDRFTQMYRKEGEYFNHNLLELLTTSVASLLRRRPASFPSHIRA